MVRVKICGVTTPAAAAHAVGCGADAVGLNFVPASPRFLTPGAAAGIVAALGPYCAPVGVFAGWGDVGRVADRLGLRAVQTYDTTPPGARFDPAAHVLAARIASAADVAALRELVRAVSPAAVLVDAYHPGALGGTGKLAPWDVLAGFDPGVPVILAGGLTPDNVADAIRAVRPWGVDVASGVESAPGVKDPGKVRAFVAAARAAG